MIQLPKNMIMFAASTDQADNKHTISKRLFYALMEALYQKI